MTRFLPSPPSSPATLLSPHDAPLCPLHITFIGTKCNCHHPDLLPVPLQEGPGAQGREEEGRVPHLPDVTKVNITGMYVFLGIQSKLPRFIPQKIIF